MSEEIWTLLNVRRGNFKCFLIQKLIPNSYFFSFRWFLIYLITTPAVFPNQTLLVRLGIFHLELGKKHTFRLWEWGRISAPNFGDREPCHHIMFWYTGTKFCVHTQYTSLFTPLSLAFHSLALYIYIYIWGSRFGVFLHAFRAEFPSPVH